jgi:hypothetical protein
MRQESSANKKKNERLWQLGLITLAAQAAASLLALDTFRCIMKGPGQAQR